ncbi:S9 family peptidase [Maricaulis sp.]|uniref:alpha/beta hydrolase family protein n=1 Tax=Maricaulis sp. TaxID=1486257 RepID=UPI00261F8E6A|nr:alpha/beta hydrolase [Maricaulis sp.]
MSDTTIKAGLFVCVLAILIGISPSRSAAQAVTTDFEFTSEGRVLSGVLDVPAGGTAEAMIVFVHGYGPTDVRGRDMYADLRTRFNALGIATAVWDKPGQGRSEGTFDIDQPVHESAQEVLDAAAHLRARNVPGSHRMGIWGVSRAGWIAPIALSQDPGFDFWISVSGTTAEDNFRYLLISNLPHEGYSAEEADRIDREWQRGWEIFRAGGSYDSYRDATPTLRANEYVTRMLGGIMSRDEYEAEQSAYLEHQGPPYLDPASGAFVHIHDFDRMLGGLDIDVLAIFGEKDLNVDWRRTRALYETTIGRNPDASLQIRTFPDADHNIVDSETGSIREMQEGGRRDPSASFYSTQTEWLRDVVLD